MDANFWHEKWAKKEIGFHEPKVNPFLVKHLPGLNLDEGARVFVPLCGKTKDIAWLLSQAYRVVGVELSELAIGELFEEMGIIPIIERHDAISHYRTEGLDIFVGDIFAVTALMIGKVDAIYDRAALVALPERMRGPYTEHLRAITHGAPQLLICFEYQQDLLDGPPFAIAEDEVRTHYAPCYTLKIVQAKPLEGGLKGKVAAVEKVYQLLP